MKPKQEAKELVDKFIISIHVYPHNYNNDLESRKKCALICVDAILKQTSQLGTVIYRRDNLDISIDEYWQEVKQEIIKQ